MQLGDILRNFWFSSAHARNTMNLQTSIRSSIIFILSFLYAHVNNNGVDTRSTETFVDLYKRIFMHVYLTLCIGLYLAILDCVKLQDSVCSILYICHDHVTVIQASVSGHLFR